MKLTSYKCYSCPVIFFPHSHKNWIEGETKTLYFRHVESK